MPANYFLQPTTNFLELAHTLLLLYSIRTILEITKNMFLEIPPKRYWNLETVHISCFFIYIYIVFVHSLYGLYILYILSLVCPVYSGLLSSTWCFTRHQTKIRFCPFEKCARPNFRSPPAWVSYSYYM